LAIEDNDEMMELFKNLKKEELPIEICGLKFPRHHHFFEAFDYKMQQLFTGGLLWVRNGSLKFNTQWPSSDAKYFRTLDEPKILNLKILEPGFVIWTSSLLFAVTAFIFEWLATFKDFLVMKYILKAFYSTRQEREQFNQTNEEEFQKESVKFDLIVEDL